eukprot:scaffold60514_cov20-Tisochrysis_lutea.AAC.3
MLAGVHGVMAVRSKKQVVGDCGWHELEGGSGYDHTIGLRPRIKGSISQEWRSNKWIRSDDQGRHQPRMVIKQVNRM